MKKKFAILMFVLAPGIVFPQIKPSVAKAETALKAGKIDEAKSIIDVTCSSQEFMVDKKGQPSKNAAKAWYFKGLIYAAIDTTKNVKYKSLETNAFPVAKEAFDKSKEIDQGKNSYFATDKIGLPLLFPVVNQYIAQKYFEQAIDAYSNKKDYKRAFDLTEQTLYFIPTDTAVIMNAGVYFGPAAEEYTKSLAYIDSYLAKGGGSSDAYIMKYSILRDKLKDNEKALKVVQEAMVKHPNNTDFPKMELDLFIKMNRLPEAKAAMEKQVNANPDDKESRYYLGIINSELKDNEEAKKWYNESIKLDSKYLEPRIALAEIIYEDAKKIKVEMNQLGITAADKKKRFELDNVYVSKLKIALPYWQDCEKISPDEAKVLDVLLNIYTDLDMQPEATKITKRMKALGLLD